MSEPRPGLVVVDKPGGLTSHGVVARVRRLAGTRKVGHAGTLDPMATGVLVVGIGRATRLLGHLMLTEKAYDATVRLGVTTTTDDAEGEVVATADAGALDEEQVRAAFAALTRRDRAGALGGVGDQGRRQARVRAGARGRGRPARRPARDRPRAHGPRRPRCRGGPVAALLERHLRPRDRPRRRRRARRRRPPDRAAADRGRAVRPRPGPHPGAARRTTSRWSRSPTRRAPASPPSTSTSSRRRTSASGAGSPSTCRRSGRSRCSRRTASSWPSTSRRASWPGRWPSSPVDREPPARG